jgi:enoyl-[acyl-carrier protein] reductase II
MLGIKHPIIAAPMGPFYTTELTIAVSEAGGLGVLSHTNLFGKSSLDELKKNMKHVVEYTDKPFGFNVRTSRVQVDAPGICRDIPKFIAKDPKLREQCMYALTSAGTPKMIQNNAFRRLKESGSQIKHFHVAPALWLADKCVAAGVDGMVVTGYEGGGHQSYEMVTTLVLLQEVLKKYPNIPLIACGGFATGAGLASAIAAGAGGVAMGSRFIASKESEFHEKYKSIVPPAKSTDTMYCLGVLGPIRLWKNKYALSHKPVSSKEEKLELEGEMSLEKALEDNKYYEVTYEGEIDNSAVLLGQSIGLIDTIDNVDKIIADITSSAEKLLKDAANKIK